MLHVDCGLAKSISGARVISVQCTYMEELDLESLHGPAHCGQSL